MQRCFVVQGYGEKTDYQQRKVFDLDASYDVIKEAVIAAGLECVRGDELKRAGTIDKTMYQELLSADLVIADITTLNFNAAYELGVRLALRPHATIVIAEDRINFPFDINHIFIHTYRHMGEDLGRREARRFHDHLVKVITEVMARQDPDSPVYEFLGGLPRGGFIQYSVARETLRSADGAAVDQKTLRQTIDQARACMRAGNFEGAIGLWSQARTIARKDDYLTQQLALATYKSELPDPPAALKAAKTLLLGLKPHDSYDPETLGLWAAVHKRLFEKGDREEDLEEALFALERGFFQNNDYYNGINLAFLLDTKASRSEPAQRAELHAFAAYVRRRLIPICEGLLKKTQDELDEGQRYWIIATMYEIHVGLGLGTADQWRERAEAASSAKWMVDTTHEQVEKLRALLP